MTYRPLHTSLKQLRSDLCIEATSTFLNCAERQRNRSRNDHPHRRTSSHPRQHCNHVGATPLRQHCKLVGAKPLRLRRLPGDHLPCSCSMWPHTPTAEVVLAQLAGGQGEHLFTSPSSAWPIAKPATNCSSHLHGVAMKADQLLPPGKLREGSLHQTSFTSISTPHGLALLFRQSHCLGKGLAIAMFVVLCRLGWGFVLASPPNALTAFVTWFDFSHSSKSASFSPFVFLLDFSLSSGSTSSFSSDSTSSVHLVANGTALCAFFAAWSKHQAGLCRRA